jgi:hypothetical protein
MHAKSVPVSVPGVPAPIRLTVTLPSLDGVSKNSVKMDFNFADDVFDVMGAVAAFFTVAAPGATNAAGKWISAFYSRANLACTIQKYSLTAPLAGTGVSGPPLLTQGFTLPVALGSSAPQEIAVGLSYHATYSSIPEHGPHSRPKARYRGRIYFGPVVTTAMTQDGTTKRCFVAPTVVTDLKAAAAKLLADQPTWGVYSRVDRIIRPVVGGWIDDEFDVQRRRGTTAISRNPWGA